jgi:hypothetical protein
MRGKLQALITAFPAELALAGQPGGIAPLLMLITFPYLGITQLRFLFIARIG